MEVVMILKGLSILGIRFFDNMDKVLVKKKQAIFWVAE